MAHVASVGKFLTQITLDVSHNFNACIKVIKGKVSKQGNKDN